MLSVSTFIRHSLVCCFIALYALSVPASAEYPRAYFGRPDVYDISLSPDGEAAAFLTNEATTGLNQSMVWNRLDIQATETGEILTTSRAPERFYNWVSWLFDEFVLVQSVQYDIKMRSKKTGHVVSIKAIDPKTGEERDIWVADWIRWDKDYYIPFLVGYSRERREIAIQLEGKSSVDLIAVNVDTGAQRRLDTGNKRTLGWELDENLTPFMRLDQGRRDNQALVYRRAETGEWTLVRAYNPLENDFRAVSRMRADNTLLVVHRPDGAKQAGLYRYNLEQNAYESLVFETEGHDLAAYSNSSFESELLYVGWYGDRLEKHWLQGKYKAISDQIDAALRPDDNWRVVETSRDQTRWLLYISSPRRAGRYFYMNLETKRIKPVVHTRPDLKDEHLYPLKTVRYAAADGLDLFGYFIAGEGGPDAPLIVLPHGGPVSRDNPDYDGLAQFLAFRGYNVFQPQFRGSGGFGVDFEIAGFGQWGQKMQTDIEDGVQALIAQDMISSAAPRSIIGGSYGGYAALAAATLTPDNYQCVVSFNGVSDLMLMLSGYDQKDVLEKYAYDIWVQRIGNPETEADKIRKVSPYDHLDKVKAPVFLIHGTEDDIVEIEQSRRAYARLTELGKPVAIHELDGADHQLSDDEHRAEMLVVLDRFLNTCMPARS